MNAIDVTGLSYRYPDGTAALAELNFEVREGARVALVGANGAGKSTLLWHLNGLLPERLPGDDKSGISILGQRVSRKNLASIRRDVGLLFQDPDDQLFCPTVAEDVAFGPEQLGVTGEALEKLVQDSLARVGLAGFGGRAPHRLSRGEKRRVCLAGVLACGARLLAFDEPSSDLDPRSRRELIATLKGLAATQIIATHDLAMVVELCPEVIVLSHGRIAAQGETRRILGDEALMLEHGLEVPDKLKR